MPHKIAAKYKILLSIIILVIVVFGIDLIRISHYKSYPVKPEQRIATHESQIYWDLLNSDVPIDWSRLDGTLEYVESEYDCADFKLVNLIRILYEFEAEIPVAYKHKIEDVLFNFRYWLDEPGENSMCYWSENHQILFASAEYLIGSKYADTIFPNSGLTGHEHMQKAKVRILDWLMMRWNYGFAEFYSEVYYKEDIAALVNLIDHSDDIEIIMKSKIILDLLFYDVATQSCNAMFVSVSGRAYESGRKGPRTLDGVMQYLWGSGEEIGAGIMYGFMHTKKYQLPPVIKEIARDSSAAVIKQSNGLDISELKGEGYGGKDTPSLMMQWGMEAFVNPGVVRNSLSHIRTNRMFSNAFLTDFKSLDFTFLRLFQLEPFVLKQINPQYNGTAIQRGNTYTYKTKDYSLYTVQSYHAGDYADQHHVSGMNISDHFAIYHAHPALKNEVHQHSPNYWVGYGHLPHAVQDKNVNLSVYNIPSKKGMMESDLLNYTHAYFPKAQFDTTVLVDNYAFGKKGETYCAFIGRTKFHYREGTNDDIIQEGKKIFWITEAGSKTQDGSFENFAHRIRNNKLDFDAQKLELCYHSSGRQYDLSYNASFKVDGKDVNTHYPRYDSPYVTSDRKAEMLKIKIDNTTLFLDFKNMVRAY